MMGEENYEHINSIDDSFEKIRDIKQRRIKYEEVAPFEVNIRHFKAGTDIPLDISYTLDMYYIFRAITWFSLSGDLGFDAAMELFYCTAHENPYSYREEGIAYLEKIKKNDRYGSVATILGRWNNYSLLFSYCGTENEDLVGMTDAAVDLFRYHSVFSIYWYDAFLKIWDHPDFSFNKKEAISSYLNNGLLDYIRYDERYAKHPDVIKSKNYVVEYLKQP